VCVRLLFLLVQREMRGYVFAAVVAAALGHEKDLPSSACAACGTLPLLFQ
jgi:hypothetical protein